MDLSSQEKLEILPNETAKRIKQFDTISTYAAAIIVGGGHVAILLFVLINHLVN